MVPTVASTHDNLVAASKAVVSIDGGDSKGMLVAETSMDPQAGTSGSVYVSFLHQGEWTDPALFFTGAQLGEVKSKQFGAYNVHGSSVRFSIKADEGHDPESWSFWRIIADGPYFFKSGYCTTTLTFVSIVL